MTEKLEEYQQQRRRQEELQKTDNRIEKSHRQGQEGISLKNMQRDHRITENKALRYNAQKDEGTRVERQPWDSKYWN